MFEDADFATFHGTALWYPSAHSISAQRFRMGISINYSLVCWFEPAYMCIVLTKIRNVFASVMLVVKQCHELSTVSSGHSYRESRCAAVNQLRFVLLRRINCVFSSSSKIVLLVPQNGTFGSGTFPDQSVRSVSSA